MIHINFNHLHISDDDKLELLQKVIDLGWSQDFSFKVSDSSNDLLDDPQSNYWFVWNKSTPPTYPDFVEYKIL